MKLFRTSGEPGDAKVSRPVRRGVVGKGSFQRYLAGSLPYHEDTRYPHAHALAFGQKEVHIKSEAFQSWWRAVRQALEREQAAAQELQHEQRLEQERAAALQQDAGLVQDVATGQQPRSNQMQQEMEHLQARQTQWQQEAAFEQPGAELADEGLEQAQEQQRGWGLEL